MNLLTLSELKRRVESLCAIAERRMSWVDVQSALGELDRRLASGLAYEPQPAPERRPTRTEAVKAIEESCRQRGYTVFAPAQTHSEVAEISLDAIAALFGGFAPEPVEVPGNGGLANRGKCRDCDALLRRRGREGDYISIDGGVTWSLYGKGPTPPCRPGKYPREVRP